MSSPRLRRLRLDYERLESRFAGWPAIRITPTAGDPPEQYQVTYDTRGLYATPTGQILERNQHVVDIELPLDYPRRAPQCKMLTPIFHPNFDEVSVGIGDFWAPSEGLDDLIVRIGRMIAYQEYNTKSRLNPLAGQWAAQNAHLLPVDRRELAPPADHAPVAVVRLDGGDETLPSGWPDVSDESAPARVPSVPRLVFGGVGVALREMRTTVGRAPDNHIQLIHASVSSHHASLLATEEGILLRDLGSTNGSTRNGVRVTETLIQPGDELYFGDLGAVFAD